MFCANVNANFKKYKNSNAKNTLLYLSSNHFFELLYQQFFSEKFFTLKFFFLRSKMYFYFIILSVINCQKKMLPPTRKRCIRFFCSQKYQILGKGIVFYMLIGENEAEIFSQIWRALKK